MTRALWLLMVMTACGGSDPVDRPKTFGGDRPVTLQTPATLEDGKTYPLLVVLHGYGATGFVQEAYFRVNGLPAANQAFVLAPDGLIDSTNHQFWNADPACCDFDHQNPDDVGYIGGLIDDVLASWPVDHGAVFVLGHSNGGFMAYRMACDRADVISAIGVLAGDAASMPASCQPSRTVNVLHVHGTADAVVPYDPGTGSVTGLGAEASVMQWAGHNGCGTTRTAGADLDLDTAVPGAEAHTSSTTGCPAGGAVDLWSLEGSGHLPVLSAEFPTLVMQWFTDHRRS